MSMMPVTAALLISNRQLWEQTHACIQSLPVRIALEQSELADIDELLDRIERHRTDVVLVEMSRLPIPLEEFVRRLRQTSAQTAAFVLHLEAAPKNILEALHAGAAEYLHPPLTEPLRNAFERLSADRSRTTTASPGGLGRIFGFISARGGSGATTFACHTARDLSRRLAMPVLLADFDFHAGMVRFVMKAKATYSVRDALDNMHRMDSSYWKALISTQNRLDIIPAPEDLAARRPGEARETAHVMRFIRSNYQAAVIDFGRHVSRSALDSLPELDRLYIVAGTGLDDLDCARECIAAAEACEVPRARIQVLLNRVSEKTAPDPAGIERFLGLAPSAMFSNEPAPLYDAWSEGRLLDENSRLGREFASLAGSLASRVLGTKPESAPPAKTDTGGVRRIFSFLQRSSS